MPKKVVIKESSVEPAEETQEEIVEPVEPEPTQP